MRHFHSYGPVDCEEHFCVKRQELITQGVEQLIGQPEKGGHYFTIWAPRQTGKTWLMRQIRANISKRYPDFTVYSFSLGNLRGMSSSPVFKRPRTVEKSAYSYDRRSGYNSSSVIRFTDRAV